MTTVKHIKGEFSSATAQGRYVVVNVTVANRTRMPQSFDPYVQTRLKIRGTVCSLSSAGESADRHADGFFVTDIQPGEHATGDLVFDVSTRHLSGLRRHAGLLVGNFNTDLDLLHQGDQLAVIVLGGP